MHIRTKILKNIIDIIKEDYPELNIIDNVFYKINNIDNNTIFINFDSEENTLKTIGNVNNSISERRLSVNIRYVIKNNNNLIETMDNLIIKIEKTFLKNNYNNTLKNIVSNMILSNTQWDFDDTDNKILIVEQNYIITYNLNLDNIEYSNR